MAPTEAIAGAFRRIAACIQIAETAMMAKSSMKQLCQRPVVSLSQPKTIGITKPPRPPIMPTTPPTAPTAARVVDGDVLVDRGLAKAHHEAKREQDDDERRRPNREGQDRSRDRRHREDAIHHGPRALTVRQEAAIGAEQAAGDRVAGGKHPSRFDVEAVGADQIARQPQRQRDETAEGEEIVECEAPDLRVLQRRKFLRQGLARQVARLARQEFRIVVGREPEDDSHHGKDGRPDFGHSMPAEGDEHEGGHEFRHRRADIAGAEDAERRALLLSREEGRDIGHADRKGAAREAHAESGDQGLGVGVRVGQQEGR